MCEALVSICKKWKPLFFVAFNSFPVGILFILGAAVIATRWPLYTYRFAHFHFTHLLTMILLLVSLIEMRRRNNSRPARTTIDAPLILMFLIGILAILNSYISWDPRVPTDHRHLIVQLTGLGLILFPVGIFFATIRGVSSVAWIKTIYYSMISVVFCLGLLAILNRLPGVVILGYDGIEVDFGVLYGIGFPLAYSGVLFSKNNTKRVLWSFIAGIILFAIVTRYHSGFRTFFVPIVAVLVVNYLRSKRLFVYTCCAAIIVAIVAYGPVLDIMRLKSESLNYRLIIWQDTFNVLRQHWSYWCVGVGPGNYYAYSLVYTFNATLDGAWGLTTPHSQYFVILVEMGVLGLLCFLWFIVNTMRILLRIFDSSGEDPFSRSFFSGIIAVFAGMLAVCIFSDSLICSVSNSGFDRICSVIYFWILLGLAFCMARLTGAKTL